MNRIATRSVKGTALLSLFAAVSFACAANANDAQSLERGAVADVTPQQKYQSAIREAGGAYKEWLRECVQLAAADQRACRLEAKATYDADMAQAKRILQRR
jgi:hypothetical protein